MKPADVARLIALAAIWGASFLFMRIAAPALGPIATADARMLIAGIALLAYFRAVGFDPQWRRWGVQYAIVGTMNSGLPFLLYAYAALSLPAGLLAVLNATAPMWGMALSVIFLRERVTPARALGLLLGIVGVAVLSQPQPGAGSASLAIAAAITAAFFYGFTGVYLKRFAPQVPARGMAVGTQVAAGVVLAPLLAIAPPSAVPSTGVVASILALGLLSGAVAYILYFRLLADIGPTGALTVTYLIPIFGVLFGALFLGEAITLATLAGGALVVLGTVLVLRG